MYLGAGLKSSIWSEIASYAGELFYNMCKKNHNNDKVSFMLGQMASFKCGENYYSTKYSPSYIKPKLWWQMVADPTDYLKSLALKLFSIIPHSASCERSFSMLSFIYGKRRQCLSNSTVEMIAKIRYYSLSNMKNELNDLLTNKESELELKTLIQECGFYDDDETNDSDDEIDDIIDVDSEIPSHDVYVLIVNNMIDLNNSIFTGDFEEEVHNDSSDDDDEILDDEELDFEIIAKISAPSNM